mmetsp:Transcript_12253/g.31063  ORF Transcript_12253/g.31063 Transcript_12253/m.31063 type:complete len:370 (+) Transcript_12253:1338-2447(+)
MLQLLDHDADGGGSRLRTLLVAAGRTAPTQLRSAGATVDRRVASHQQRDQSADRVHLAVHLGAEACGVVLAGSVTAAGRLALLRLLLLGAAVRCHTDHCAAHAQTHKACRQQVIHHRALRDGTAAQALRLRLLGGGGCCTGRLVEEVRLGGDALQEGVQVGGGRDTGRVRTMHPHPDVEQRVRCGRGRSLVVLELQRRLRRRGGHSSGRLLCRGVLHGGDRLSGLRGRRSERAQVIQQHLGALEHLGRCSDPGQRCERIKGARECASRECAQLKHHVMQSVRYQREEVHRVRVLVGGELGRALYGGREGVIELTDVEQAAQLQHGGEQRRAHRLRAAHHPAKQLGAERLTGWRQLTEAAQQAQIEEQVG